MGWPVFPEGEGRLGRKDKHQMPSSFRDFLSQKNRKWSKSFSFLPKRMISLCFFQTIKLMGSEMVWLSLAPVNFIVIHGQIYLCLVLIYNLSISCSEEIWLKRHSSSCLPPKSSSSTFPTRMCYGRGETNTLQRSWRLPSKSVALGRPAAHH